MHHLRGEPRSEQDASAEDSIRSPGGGGGGGWAVWKEKDSREEEATAFELKDCAPLSVFPRLLREKVTGASFTSSGFGSRALN
jgi:hypothetical protein